MRLAAMRQFRDRHYGRDPTAPGIEHRWFTAENPHPYVDDYEDEE